MPDDVAHKIVYKIPHVFNVLDSHAWMFEGLNWSDEQIAAVKAAIQLAKAESPSPSEQPEIAVEKHVDAVIDHLNKGRVVPRKVDELAGAVARARTDGAVGRAIGSRGTR